MDQGIIFTFNVSEWTDFCLSNLRAVDSETFEGSLINTIFFSSIPEEEPENVQFCRDLESVKTVSGLY